MSKRSIAGQTLETARFFAGQANGCGTASQEPFESYLSAAIVFGRSALSHIQSEYARQPGFSRWHARLRKEIDADPVLAYFQKTRNFIIHQGPVPVSKKLIPPVYEDRVAFSYTWREWTGGRGRFPNPITRSMGLPVKVQSERTVFCLDIPDLGTRPVSELLEGYLARLEKIVADAEQRFGADRAAGT